MSPSDEAWQKVLWHAAGLVRLAEEERRTIRAECGDSAHEDPRQMMLFDD